MSDDDPSSRFVGAAAAMTADDVAAAAASIGCAPAALRAVLHVETSGSGFDRSGRPRMLFEPHIFYRLLAAADDEQLQEAVAQGLAYQAWGARPYPADSYPRLIAACTINDDLALESASWGIGQIMGENYAAAGYETVQAMVDAAVQSESAQLGMMAAFIRASGLARSLAARDWPSFAAGYNGRGQVQVYAGRLQAAYQNATA